MKKVLIAGLIAVSAVGAQAHGFYSTRHNHSVAGAVLTGMVIGAVIDRAVHPVYAPQPQVVYQQTYPQTYPQYEYRTPPVYSNQYPAPTVSCIPAYTQQGQYIGCVR
jgi:hypothetical protein